MQSTNEIERDPARVKFARAFLIAIGLLLVALASLGIWLIVTEPPNAVLWLIVPMLLVGGIRSFWSGITGRNPVIDKMRGNAD